jgi:hypothetical protein
MSLLGGLARGIAVGAATTLVGELLSGDAEPRAGRRGRGLTARGAAWGARDRPFTPAGALARGLVAGAAGSFAQALFAKATRRLAPAPPEGAFTPPEPAQRGEQATHTVARRTVECLMQRGPIRDKERAGAIVHYAFGAAWGGVYGVLRGSYEPVATPAGVLAFSTVVWAVSDNLLLPAFRLSAWPRAYPPESHLYAWAAHVAYGAAVWAAFEAQRRSTWIPVAAALSARWATRRLPAPVRPRAARILTAVRSAGVGDRLRAVAREAAVGAVARAA